jgi:hypothetical protein
MKKHQAVKRPSSRDPLNVQINVVAHLPRGTRPTKRLIQEAIRYRIEHEEDHPRFETKIIRWRNPGRTGKLGGWRQGNQSDAWRSLKRVLRFADVDVFTVRSHQGNRK